MGTWEVLMAHPKKTMPESGWEDGVKPRKTSVGITHTPDKISNIN
jgi:hypothetical protein